MIFHKFSVPTQNLSAVNMGNYGSKLTNFLDGGSQGEKAYFNQRKNFQALNDSRSPC